MIVTSELALDLVPHNGYEESQLIVACGQKGFGKTWWIRHYALAEPRVLVLDIHDEFYQVPRRLRYQDAIEDLASRGDAPCWRRVIPPHEGSTFEFGTRFFEAVRRDVRNILLVIPEFSAYSRAKGGIEGTPLETIILRGRHYGIRLCLDIQRMNRVPGEVHSELTDAVIFHTRRPRDLDVLESWGVKDAHEVLPKLKKRQCYLLRG